MPPSSQISSRGRVTIAIEIRRLLGLNAGDCVEFFMEGERAVIRHAQANPFEKYVGALPTFKSEIEINTRISDLRDDS
jgi:AbrB family looped-hinge helix DNA binding protein